MVALTYLPFPVVKNLSQDLINRWYTFYANDPDKFPKTSEEGLWRRTQCYETRSHSGWESPADSRRRMIHYKHHFDLVSNPDGTVDLALVGTYLWLHLCLPSTEISEYTELIEKGLSEGKWELVTEKRTSSDQYANFRKRELACALSLFEEHDQDRLAGRVLPDEYKILEIEFISDGCDLEDDFATYPWNILNSGIRKPEVRGNPIEIMDNNVEKIIELFPAQVELGCGPSIEVGIPPLHFLHKVYYVTNTETHKSVYGTLEDRLAYEIAHNTHETLKTFTMMYKKCFLAEPTDFYYALKRLREAGLIVGDIISHNFDGLPTRLGMKEICDRRYDTPFNYSVSFHPEARSLLVVGCHADRRRVQSAAREKGLKVVYIDPEGFFTDDGFESYPLESPQDGDLLYSQTAGVAFQHIERKLIKMA